MSFRKGLAGIIAVSLLLINAPLFSLELEIGAEYESVSSADPFLNPETQTPVLPESFDTEFTKAGRLINYTAVLAEQEETSDEPVPLTDPDEPVMISLAEEAAAEPDIYISAGPDGYGYTGTAVVLGSDVPVPEGVLVAWEQTGGPEVEIENPGSGQTAFTPRFEGVYTFLLIAAFPDGSTAADSAVFLIDDPEGNRVPSAWAGDDIYIGLEPGVPSKTELSGTGFDADNDPLTFLWEQTGGVSVEITPLQDGKAECIFTEPGVYTFNLTVHDGSVLSIPDEVNVVCFTIDNHPPVAVASDVRVDHTGTPVIVVLDGSGSFDPDGDYINYSWEQIEGRPVQLSGAAGSMPVFTCKDEGCYLFKMTVDDGVSAGVPVIVSVEAARPLEEADNSFGCSPSGTGADGIVIFLLASGLLLIGRRKEWEKQNTV